MLRCDGCESVLPVTVQLLAWSRSSKVPQTIAGRRAVFCHFRFQNWLIQNSRTAPNASNAPIPNKYDSMTVFACPLQSAQPEHVPIARTTEWLALSSCALCPSPCAAFSYAVLYVSGLNFYEIMVSPPSCFPASLHILFKGHLGNGLQSSLHKLSKLLAEASESFWATSPHGLHTDSTRVSTTKSYSLIQWYPVYMSIWARTLIHSQRRRFCHWAQSHIRNKALVVLEDSLIFGRLQISSNENSSLQEDGAPHTF
jgi:hypothetical protein